MAHLAESSKLILALETGADALSADSVKHACSGAFWTERFGDRGSRRIAEDARHHISQLITALQFADPSILVNYAIWLQEVLTNRRMCSRHLVEHFDALSSAIHRHGLPDANAAERYLHAASEALAYRSGAAGSVQRASNSLRSTMMAAWEGSQAEVSSDRAHLRSDIDYLLSYLADAVKLERKDVFAEYVVWIDGYFMRRQRRDGYRSALLSALEAALRECEDAVRASCDPCLREARSWLEASGGPDNRMPIRN